MIKEFTFGSVCSGIEAASVAWEPLGWKPSWFAEIEPFPATVLAHHYPRVANLGDMTQIAMLVRMGFVDAPDALVGGTPCQAFSVAGVRGGLSDPRGQLTLAYADLANAIDEKRRERGEGECVIYWENVPGVLSTADNAFGCFLGLLAGEDTELTPEPKPADGKNSKYWKWSKDDAKHSCRWPNVGCVYGPERAIAWRVLDAQYFGVAQRRRRVFVVASAREGFNPAAILFESDGVRRDIAPSRQAGQNVTAGTLRSTDGGCDVDHALANHLIRTDIAYAPPISACLETTSNDYSRADGFTAIVHAAGSAYAFQPRIARNGRGDMGDVVDALTAQAGTSGKGDAAPCVALAFDSRQECISSPHVFGALGSSSPQAQAVCIAFTTEQTPKYNDDCALTLTRQSPTGGGQIQSVMHPVVIKGAAIGREPHNDPQYGETRDDGTVYTLNCTEQHAVQYGTTVRRLTPRECERLQGFPDDYTLVPMRGKPAADGPRYKALGNSMAVPCMRWLGARLMLTHPELFMLERLAA